MTNVKQKSQVPQICAQDGELPACRRELEIKSNGKRNESNEAKHGHYLRSQKQTDCAEQQRRSGRWVSLN